MAGELEKFLQQAAERLAQKINEATNPPGNKPSQSSSEKRTVRSAERQRPPVVEAEIIEAEVIEPAYRRELGPDPLSNIDTRPALAQQISQADERMAGRLHDVFDHEVMNLPQASSALQRPRQGETEKSIDLQRRTQDVSPLVQMLRQPDTLRAAFVASEIFKRKF